MFKKNFSFIYLILAFPSFDNQMDAMQEPEATTQQDIFNCTQEICSILSTADYETLESIQQICPSLKSLAASKYLKILKSQGQELNALGTDIMSEDLKIYCKQCNLIPLIPFINLIHKHIASLEEFKKHECLKITDQNLNSYNTLLHQLIYSIDLQDINIENILSAINKAFTFRSFYSITLEDINFFLKLLMQFEDIDFPDYEISYLYNILHIIATKDKIDLFKLLMKNKKLLPQLNQIVIHDETFLMLLVQLNDIDLFGSIINEEKNKNYDWKTLLNLRTKNGRTILHYAARSSKDIFVVILELIKEKGLHDLLHDLMNTKSEYGHTALMVATLHDNYEIIKLLIDHGANINISSKSDETALDYAMRAKEKLLSESNINPEILEKVDRCITLLTQN